MHSVAASGTTAFLQRHVCADTNCRRAAAQDLVRVDLSTGTATPFDGCLGLAACRACFGRAPLRLRPPRRRARHQRPVRARRGRDRPGDGRDAARPGARHRRGRPVRGHQSGRGDADRHRLADRRDDPPAQRRLPHERRRRVALDADGTLAWSYGAGVYVLAPGAAQPAHGPARTRTPLRRRAGRGSARDSHERRERRARHLPGRRPRGPGPAQPLRLGVRRLPARLGRRAVWESRHPGVGPRHRTAAAGERALHPRAVRRREAGRKGAVVTCASAARPPPHAAARARSPPICSRAAGRSQRRSGGSTGSGRARPGRGGSESSAPAACAATSGWSRA